MKKITELDSNLGIQIDVSKGNKSLSFSSRTVEVVGDSLLIEIVKEAGEIVNMLVERDTLIELTINTDPLPVVFTGVELRAVKYKGEPYYRIRTKQEGQEINRRNNFRVFIGEGGKAEIENETDMRNVLVKDVSVSGFAFVIGEDLELEGSKVKMSYLDDGAKIMLQGEIVRKQVIDENKIIYGCKTISGPSNLSAYLNQKQVEKKRGEAKE